eukprot:TRINITY_DN6286_c0_g1_i1.p1 TRINITY_DN6286_c0_g1~~TRINITY_DN6286_c0_g1_i1.p1  ORF type:complete len:234 (-),score=52.24 TRINITY_DN6286_c0_g1_i1:61-762(-)
MFSLLKNRIPTTTSVLLPRLAILSSTPSLLNTQFTLPLTTNALTSTNKRFASRVIRVKPPPKDFLKDYLPPTNPYNEGLSLQPYPPRGYHELKKIWAEVREVRGKRGIKLLDNARLVAGVLVGGQKEEVLIQIEQPRIEGLKDTNLWHVGYRYILLLDKGNGVVEEEVVKLRATVIHPIRLVPIRATFLRTGEKKEDIIDEEGLCVIETFAKKSKRKPRLDPNVYRETKRTIT